MKTDSGFLDIIRVRHQLLSKWVKSLKAIAPYVVKKTYRSGDVRWPPLILVGQDVPTTELRGWRSALNAGRI